MLPNLPNGHLYQWMTTCGTLLAVASIIGMGVRLNHHDALVRETIGHVLQAENSPEPVRQFWANYLQQQKKDAETVLCFFIATTTLGLIVGIAGGTLWYFKVQRHEDEKRRLENLQLLHDTDEKTGTKRLVVAA